MSEEEDHVAIEMEEKADENDFIDDLFDKLNRRGQLEKRDLYFDMFSCGSAPFWYLSQSHEYAVMLRENGYVPIAILNGKKEGGQVEVYDDHEIQLLINQVWDWMKKYNKV